MRQRKQAKQADGKEETNGTNGRRRAREFDYATWFGLVHVFAEEMFAWIDEADAADPSLRA